MKTIWKFTLDLASVNRFEMPEGAEVLSVAEQHGAIQVWAKVESDAPTERRTFEVYGTGHRIPQGPKFERRHAGTVQLEEGALVFHVFERV